jgi:hypothetical protein
MLTARYVTAAALAFAPCLLVGCDDNEVEPSVGEPAVAVDVDVDDDHVHVDGDDHMEGEDDSDVERPSDELEDEE